MVISIICIIINIAWALYCGRYDYYDGFFPEGRVGFTGFNYFSPEVWIILFSIISLILLIIFKDKLKIKKVRWLVDIIVVVLTIISMSICTMFVNR